MILLLTGLDSGCAEAFSARREAATRLVPTLLFTQPQGFRCGGGTCFSARVFGRISTFADDLRVVSVDQGARCRCLSGLAANAAAAALVFALSEL